MPDVDQLLVEVERFLAPFRAEGHEMEFRLSYYYGFRELSDSGYAMWWHAELYKNRDGVSATERTPVEAIRMALGLAREKAAA